MILESYDSRNGCERSKHLISPLTNGLRALLSPFAACPLAIFRVMSTKSCLNLAIDTTATVVLRHLAREGQGPLGRSSGPAGRLTGAAAAAQRPQGAV